MQILWIRHGQTQGNVERRYVGRTDEELTLDSREKLKMRKQQGIGFAPDLVYVSPMIRCRETADLLFPEQKKCHGTDCRKRILEILNIKIMRIEE